MGAETKIAWCHATFNPWRGCTKVSAGCEHCYAETMSKRNPAVLGEWGRGGQRALASEAYWHKPLAWNHLAAREGIRGVRRRVFCGSLMDVFEDRLELISSRMRLLDLVARTPGLDWLLLTKRPAGIVARLREIAECGLARPWAGDDNGQRAMELAGCWLEGDAPANVWMGVSVEDQKTADERIPLLLRTPAAVSWVSYEPAIGPVNFGDALGRISDAHEPNCHAPGIDWVVVGGESGPGARPFDVAWARSVVAQCRAAGVSCFVKQMGSHVQDRNDAGFEADLETFADGPNAGKATDSGAWPSPRDVEHNPADTNYQGAPVRIRLRSRSGADPAEWPLGLRVRELPQ